MHMNDSDSYARAATKRMDGKNVVKVTGEMHNQPIIWKSIAAGVTQTTTT